MSGDDNKPGVDRPTSLDELGRRVERVCEMIGTRKESAEAAGLSTDQLLKVCKGKSDTSFRALAGLALRAGVSLDWLATGIGPMIIGTSESRVYTPLNSSQGHVIHLSLPPSVPVIGLAECGLRGWFQEDSMSVRATRPEDLRSEDSFAVMAAGKSMIPAGILPGHLCFCDPGDRPYPGDAVFIERIDGRASLKLLLKADNDWITLQGWLDPEDDKQEPYTDKIAASQIKKIATVVYVKRKL